MDSRVDLEFLVEENFHKKTRAGLEWILRSIEVTGNHGSSAFFSRLFPPFGWAKAYPETTGYIINTLLDFDSIYPDLQLKDSAINCANWICNLQLQDGALPGGFANSPEPSVFNTGQMLLGLNQVYELTQDEKYLNVIVSAVNWLVSIQEKDGSWKLGAYVNGYIPSYYTRVIWPVLWSNRFIKNEKINDSMKSALSLYTKRITRHQSVKDWGFKPGQKAFTHTIAYTIRGFYESSRLLEDQDLHDRSVLLAEKVMKLREIKGSLAGWYDENWNGDYWFTCLTGNAQMSIILSKLYLETGDLRYLNASLKIFGDIVFRQKLSKRRNVNGALPGSSPFYGRYLTLRYPNWATKFYLDAYLLLKTSVAKLK